MTPVEIRVDRARGRSRRLLGAGAVLALATAVGGAGALPATASVPHSGTAIVVKIAAKRAGFTNVLTTTSRVGKTLYTAASCTGVCLSSWPPLLMPKGKTIPKGPPGLRGLGTARFGSRLQVTYKRHRLYTFTGDSGASVNGNGVGGFTVIHNV